MKMRYAIAALVIFPAMPAIAQVQNEETPAMGETVTAAVGGTVWEQYQYAGKPGIIIEGSVQAQWGSAEFVDLPAGSALVVLREKKMKACRKLTQLPNIGTSFWSDCLFDTDGDGKFDRVSYNSNGFSKPIETPIPYHRGVIPMDGDGGSPTFRKVILYLGADGSSLKLSYREFSNDMARPAFTEDFSIPLGKTFPQNIAVKDKVITVLGLDGMGLKYQLVK